MMRVRTTSTGSVQAVESAEAMKPSAAEFLMSRWRRPASSAVNWTTVGNQYPRSEYDALARESLHCREMLLLQLASCCTVCALLLAFKSGKGSGTWSGLSELLEDAAEAMVERCCRHQRSCYSRRQKVLRRSGAGVAAPAA